MDSSDAEDPTVPFSRPHDPDSIDTPPAEGERRAIGGYHGQYSVGAWLIARALQERTLEWIRVADPEAGRVDDLQLGTPGRVDAYQVKWSLYPDHLTFIAFTSASGDEQSLIRQLADGWVRLSGAHPNRRVVVHLVTNQTSSPSVSAVLPVVDPKPQPAHFAAFLAQVWSPWHDGAVHAVPETWLPVWDALRAASGLDPDAFERFVENCDLDLGSHLPRGGASATPEERQTQDDIDHIEQRLFAAVADPARPVELNRAELLERLGWQDRFRAGRYHDFPMPPIYEPIQVTVDELGAALDRLTGGYLALLGSPGSGKSTLLTHVLRMRQERVIPYYAYVPDYRDTSRAEATSFLSDLVVTIEEAGFRPGSRPSQPDRAVLTRTLQQQLAMLHADYAQEGRRTIILVDGLDHVPRLRPDRSLLKDLPFPVPEGVLVVVGSQTDQLDDLPPGVQSQIQQNHIVMQPLSTSATEHVLSQSSLAPYLSDEQRSSICELCAGHPLALGYLLNELGKASAAEIPAVLQRTHPYGQDILDYYADHWDEFGRDSELTVLLGLLARLRRPFDLTWLHQWPEKAALPRLTAELRRYFGDEGGKRWSFFHDSFRQFVLERTAEAPPGEFEDSLDADLHAKLADRCRESPQDHPDHWETLYHLHKAGKHDEVLVLATQDWFRSQFLHFRPHHAIREDILAALRSAGERQDAVALTRLVLVGTEMSQREFQFSGLTLVSLLLRTGQAETAFEHARTGYRLHLSEEAGLEFAAQALAAGYQIEASRIFELAEPTWALHGDTRTGTLSEEHAQLLQVWASVATRFVPLDQVIETISVVDAPESAFHQQRVPTGQLRRQMLFATGTSLLQQGRWDDFERAAAAIQQYDAPSGSWWFWLQVRAWRYTCLDEEPDRAEAYLERARRHTSIEEIGNGERVTLAEGVYRLLHDETAARELIAGCPQPEVVRDFWAEEEEGLGPYVHRFALNRLFAAIGECPPPEDLVPDPDEARLDGLVHFERGLVKLAQLHGRVWRGTVATAAQFMSAAQPLLRLFNREWSASDHQTGWHSILGLRAEFYQRLIHAAIAHGPETVADLRRAFEEEWARTATWRYWPHALRRSLVVALAGEAGSRWARDQLISLEDSMLAGLEASGQVSECLSHADAWSDVGETEEARRLLDKAVAVSAGIGSHKDYQMNQWISWLGRTVAEDPDTTRERIHWFARATTAMDELGLDGAPRAADGLLEVVFDWSPRRSIDLFQAFSAKGVVGYQSGLTVLLTAALQSARPPIESVLAVCSELLIPFQTRDVGSLPHLLVARAHQCYGEAQALVCARGLAESVDIWALPSERPAWRRGIATALLGLGIPLAAAGLSGHDSRPEARWSSSVLKIEGEDEPLETHEVLARTATIPDLLRLRREERSTTGILDRFDWRPVVVPLLADADARQVRTLADAFLAEDGDPEVVAECCERLIALDDDSTARVIGLAALTAERGGWRHDAWHLAKTVLPLLNREQTLQVVGSRRADSGDALILAECSKRLTALGDTTAARSAAMQALGQSPPQGWDIRWDHGTRIAALQALQLVDPEDGRAMAWQSLIEDVAAEHWYPEVTARNLEDILPLLTETVPLPRVWSEIEKHVQALFAATRLPEDDILLIDERPENDAPALALAGLIVDHVNHPVTAVAQAAQRACGSLLLRRHGPVLTRVRTGLGASEDLQAHLLMVLEAVSLEAPAAVAGLDTELQRLATSRNYMIRTSARAVCAHLGVALPQHQPDGDTLPPMYRIALPDAQIPSPYSLPQVSAYRPAPDLPDPLQVVSPFELQLDALSERTEIPLTNLCRRAVQIMHELRPGEEWSASAELHLRDVLSGTGLELPFRRPRCQTAWLAVFHVVAELVDAGVLDARTVFAPGSPFRFYDPDMVLSQPQVRPSVVGPVAGRDRFGGHNDEWIQLVRDALACAARELSSGQIVLAEETALVQAEFEAPTEVRRSVPSALGSPVDGGAEDASEAPALVRSMWRREYPDLGHSIPPELIILRHDPLWYDSPGANWLALNPAVAASLGWTPAEDGLFRWLNEDGDIMVETVWWADGLRARRREVLSDELGEGWLVAASPAALEAILGLFPHASRVVTARRSYTADGEEIAQTAATVDHLS